MEPWRSSSSCPSREVSAGLSLSLGPESSEHCAGREVVPSSSPPVEDDSRLSLLSAAATLTMPGKLFVDGLSSEMGVSLLVEHFAEYGELREVTVKRDHITGNSRGFGYVRFVNPNDAESPLKEAMHVIDGKRVDVKRATRDRWHHTAGESSRSINYSSFNNGSTTNPKKIFIGGLPDCINQLGLKNYFENFGSVNDAVVMSDKIIGWSRGFGLVTFSSEDSVAMIIASDGAVVVVVSAEGEDASGLSSLAAAALLVEHFAKYGELREVTVKRDRITGNSRGFGFARFVNPDDAESTLKDAMHVFDGKTVLERTAGEKGALLTAI
ncbi:hypothetical protein MUK42_11019 [Musa troglodytarum]|uniref:RRM domain-containing protein n=1 Tax=Musa troglodytarum TaxID=320322 RepID=A0A9E7KIL0_9LILI|nr:hypothetical protein MUK42_11019 [Musa troglodytarum]